MAKRKNPNEDEPNDHLENTNDDDTFGLPEIEYQPLNRDEPREETVSETSSYSYENEESPVEGDTDHDEIIYEEDPNPYAYSDDDDSPPLWPRILGIVLLLLVVGGGVAYYFIYYKPQKDEEKRQAELAEAKRINDERRERARLDSLNQITLREQRIADSLANIQPKGEGSIETLSGRTGRYYVIAASAIDDDLLMDYAKKLTSNGVNIKIIPPYGRVKFHRLAIAEGDSYESTQSTADGMKGEYGADLWVLKY